ncbi:MAG: hypothetical protein FJ296_00990 [Planctomycetes bacterium]|nr:hypothetical protein [Planctomycetota bacterium]
MGTPSQPSSRAGDATARPPSAPSRWRRLTLLAACPFAAVLLAEVALRLFAPAPRPANPPGLFVADAQVRVLEDLPGPAGRRLVVVNASVPGHGTWNELGMLEACFADVQPDTVLLALYRDEGPRPLALPAPDRYALRNLLRPRTAGRREGSARAPRGRQTPPPCTTETPCPAAPTSTRS